jgi:Leucine-rich repeat (LRR) protein
MLLSLFYVITYSVFFLVGQLVRLERLSISGNLLTSLPATIGSLRNVSNYNNETWISSDFYTAIWNFEDCMHYALMCGYGYHHCILVGFQGVWDHFNHRHLRKEYFSMPYIYYELQPLLAWTQSPITKSSNFKYP